MKKNKYKYDLIFNHISVGGAEADINGFTSKAVQIAVDALSSRGGGTIQLLPGIFEISAPIQLYNDIKIVGSGEQTVLRKVDGFSSKLTLDPGFGEMSIQVQDSSGFRAGMGILVHDERYPYGWDEATAMITLVEDNKLVLDRRLTNNFFMEHGAIAYNACSIIEGIEVERVTISHLVIDGNKAANDRIGGCRGGGIYLFDAEDCMIQEVKVMEFNGDGISWQTTNHIRVEHCEIFNCTGSGLHPGARSEQTIIQDCHSHHNDEDGIFVCWMVQHGQIEKNKFCFNGRHGISIGHQDTDNRFVNNTISYNHEHGVYARKESELNGAHRNQFISNRIENNGDGKGAGFYIEGCTQEWDIEDNLIRNEEGHGQRFGIVTGKGTKEIRQNNNRIIGIKQAEG